MTWREEMRPARFRGVPFYVAASTVDHQLASVEHRFAGARTAEQSTRVDYIGAAPRRYQIQAWVAGEDYHQLRAELETALLTREPGRLVHPYRGERTVSVVGSVTVQESPDRGGYAQIRFTCVDVSESSGLRTAPDPSERIDAEFDALIDELAGEAGPALEVAEAQEVDASWSDGTSRLSEGLDGVSSITGGSSSPIPAAEDMLGDADAAIRKVMEAAEAGAAIPSRLQSVVTQGRTTIQHAYDAVRAVVEPFEAAYDAFGAALSRRRAAAQDAAGLTTAAAIAASLAATVRSGPVVSVRDASAIADDLDGVLYDLAAEATLPGVGAALQRLRGSVVGRVRDAGLRSARDVQVYVDTPALVLAHDEHGDARRAGEIVARNAVRDPLAIPGGTTVEVLQ